MTPRTLEEAQDLIDELEAEVIALEPTAHECRRCFNTFYGPADMLYCSRDCEFFRAQEPFETLYRKLHPEWPTKRGTEVAQPWRPKAQSVPA